MLWDDFFNSKVNAFQDVLNSKIYIDKTGLLEYTNSVIDTTSKFICNSRPRRFGKSITADMMTAYYSRSLDTEEMFESLILVRRQIRKYRMNIKQQILNLSLIHI